MVEKRIFTILIIFASIEFSFGAATNCTDGCLSGDQRASLISQLFQTFQEALRTLATCFTDQDINECQSNPCRNGATCNNLVNGYTCTCARGYTGTACETDINECQSNPCRNGATCNNLVNGYTCTCSPGYTGTACETVGNSILILRNDNAGSTSGIFNRPWTQYLQPFGNPASQYWIGLDKLHQVTQGNCRARFDLQAINGTWYYANYSSFSVGDSSNNYRLTIEGYSGNTGAFDAMTWSKNQPFTTYDASHDAAGKNCARDIGGGFWFYDCGFALITTSASTRIDDFKWYTDSGWMQLNVAQVSLFC